MTREFKEELSKMETGSVALVYSDPNSDLTVEVMVVMVMMVMTADYLTILVIKKISTQILVI